MHLTKSLSLKLNKWQVIAGLATAVTVVGTVAAVVIVKARKCTHRPDMSDIQELKRAIDTILALEEKLKEREDVAHCLRRPVRQKSVGINGMLREVPEDAHFSDHSTRPTDEQAGSWMAHEIGDTYIDHFNQSPVQQWTQIIKALRVHGFDISFSG